MNRKEMLKHLEEEPLWDVAIIGGGATGLGAAVDATSRGFKTILLEQHDFAKGTSSRSTKLIHGGLRYLKQGNIALVMEALRERGRLCANAPHMIHHQKFFVPSYKWWEGPFYGIGIKIYDLLAGDLGLEPSEHLSKEEALSQIPTLNPAGLRGGTIYYDGQFDDARLAITLARTAAYLDATLLNYMKVTGFTKKKGLIQGLEITDAETGKTYTITAKAIINATGVFTDEVRKIDDENADPLIAPSQGIHLVLDKSFLPSNNAILVPHTEDGRVVFIVPWHDRTLIGTTDTCIHEITLEPTAQATEIEFLLETAGHYLAKKPKKSDILSIFAGLRPLVAAKSTHQTSALSRDHTIFVSSSGLISIAGGKWTTYRKMAEDVIDKAINCGNLKECTSMTKDLRLFGWKTGVDPTGHFSPYGSEVDKVKAIIQSNPLYQEKLHPHLPYFLGEVVYAARHEMARTVEDVLARRTRSLLLDAKAALASAEKVATLLQEELGKDATWKNQQLEQFSNLTKNYLA